MKPYRNDRESWQRTLEEGAELAMQDAQSFAGRIPTVRRQLDRVVNTLAMARREAESAQGNVETATLIAALESVRAVLLGKLALAEALPDIVVTPPPESEGNRDHDRVVIASRSSSSPSPSPPPPPPPSQTPTPPAPHMTVRGRQLHMIALTVRESRVVFARGLVRSHLNEPRPLDAHSRAALEAARTRLEKAFASAEQLLREAFLAPDPSSRGIDPQLATEWNEIYAEVAQLRDLVIGARGLLAR